MNVFKHWQKTGRDGDDWMLDGSEFQRRDTATGNVHWPTVVSRNDGTSSWCDACKITIFCVWCVSGGFFTPWLTDTRRHHLNCLDMIGAAELEMNHLTALVLFVFMIVIVLQLQSSPSVSYVDVAAVRLQLYMKLHQFDIAQQVQSSRLLFICKTAK